MKKTAVITGTGQDSSYLTEILLEKDYDVYVFKRRTSHNSLENFEQSLKNPQLHIVEGDLNDYPSIARLCKTTKPDEFYNLAAQSHVWTSFQQPIYTLKVNGEGVVNCLEAIRSSGVQTKFYQASTSEMFGGLQETAFNEESQFHPRSPYGAAKLYGHWITKNYRESYDMFACTGILFNHESSRRPPSFVTRKITYGIKNIIEGKEKNIALGNLDAKRDWGHAEDYCTAMVKILNHTIPDDFVIATGETHSVREFCQIAFEYAGLGDYEKYIVINPEFYRPAEVHVLIGDSTKARTQLGWIPKYSFVDLVKEMVDFDLKSLK